jgi:hypothetical protein
MGAGAFGWIDPDYTGDAGWETYVSRFRPGESSMEKIEAPKMWEMQALTLSGYGDIWFAGRPSGPDMDNVIVNFYRGKWIYYHDPSPYGMYYLHLFSHTNGWGFGRNQIYRFDGQSWNLWLELAAFQSIKPCAFKSPTNVWAVAYPADASYEGNMVLHYDGGGWHEVFRPGENKYVYDVAMLNNYNGWAVGAEKVGTQYYGRTWQCRNGVWHERVCPVEESVRSVEVVSKTEAWALTAGKILRYKTESILAPASLGRVKALYAAGRGSDSKGPLTDAYLVPEAPGPTTGSGTPTYPGTHSPECSTDDAE